MFCFASPHSVSLNRSVDTENQNKASQNKCYIVTISNKNMSPEIFKNCSYYFYQNVYLKLFLCDSFPESCVIRLFYFVYLSGSFISCAFIPTPDVKVSD